MTVYQAPRGAVKDLRFFLKSVEGGPLIDQFDFTDGLVHSQWPTVKFFTGPNGTGSDITSQIVKNIAGDTIVSASHKDPTGSSGVWRESQGTYWVRVLPQNSVTFGDYFLRISFQPTSGNTWTEDFDFEVLIPGDVDPNADITPDDVKIGFSTSFDDPTIMTYIAAAVEVVYGDLEDGGIEDPDAYFQALGRLPRSLKTAIIEATQCQIGTFDLSSGKKVKAVQEGPDKITFATPKDGFSGDPCTDYSLRVQRWLKRNAPGRQPLLTTVTKNVGQTAELL